jgi:hypothetical protein
LDWLYGYFFRLGAPERLRALVKTLPDIQYKDDGTFLVFAIRRYPTENPVLYFRVTQSSNGVPFDTLYGDVRSPDQFSATVVQLLDLLTAQSGRAVATIAQLTGLLACKSPPVVAAHADKLNAESAAAARQAHDAVEAAASPPAECSSKKHSWED